MQATRRGDGRRRLLPVPPPSVAAFRVAGRSELLQAWARWWTCPLTAIDAAVPAAGRVLEIGCGRGITSLVLADGGGGRSVVGIDINADRIATARLVLDALGDQAPDLVVEHLPAAELPDGPFDAVVAADTLYLVEADARVDLLRSAAKRLAPGGIVVIKEAGPRPAWKHGVNLVQNWTQRRLLHDLEGETVDHWSPERYAAVLGDLGFEVEQRRLDRGYTYAHFMVIGRSGLGDQP